MWPLDAAVRVYVGYVVGAVGAFGGTTLVGLPLPDGWALVVGILLIVVLTLAGAGWYGRTR